MWRSYENGLDAQLLGNGRLILDRVRRLFKAIKEFDSNYTPAKRGDVSPD